MPLDTRERTWPHEADFALSFDDDVDAPPNTNEVASALADFLMTKLRGGREEANNK